MLRLGIFQTRLNIYSSLIWKERGEGAGAYAFPCAATLLACSKHLFTSFRVANAKSLC